jgi:glycosyltransferase involved in cell wall biosynthesis
LDQNSKIKVCHLTSVHKATDTRIFFKECRSLNHDYQVVLIAPAGNSYISDGVQVIAVKTPPNRVYRFFITDILLLIKAFSIDAPLYHIHDPELIPIGLILRLFGKKIIYDIEEDFRSDIAEKKWLPLKSIFRSLFVLFERLAVNYFYLVLAEESYSEIYKNRTVNYIVVQNFVPLNEIDRNNIIYNPESNKLGLVGSLAARRGLPFILDAIRILKKKNIIVRLVCVGEKNEAVDQILKDSEAWDEVNEQVVFKGYISFPESLYAVSDCIAGLALPETLPNHTRSYPTKMFEYMAIGLPVIASDFPLYKEVVEKYHCGLTVTPEDAPQIATAIEYIFKHRDEAVVMSENARKSVMNFDWDMEQMKLLDFYDQILKREITR